MSIYDTRTMLAAISQTKPALSFMRDTFFSKRVTLVTEKAEADVKKGRRAMAPFVAPRVRGKVVERDGFVTNEIMTPKIAPIRVLTAEDLKKRTMGESVYSTISPAQRAAKYLAEDLIDLDEQITRREEWFCTQIMLGGAVDIEVEGQTINVDYAFDNKVTLSGTAKWNGTAAKIYANLKAWKKQIVKKSGKAPNIVLMATDVVDVFLADTEIQKLFDAQRMNLGIIEPKIIADGVTFIGRLPELGVEIYTYEEFYTDDEGTEQEMIPSGTVIMAARDLGAVYYGAVTQKEKGAWITYEGTRVPKYTPDDKEEVDELRMVGRPIPAPFDVDSWLVASVL